MVSAAESAVYIQEQIKPLNKRVSSLSLFKGGKISIIELVLEPYRECIAKILCKN